MTSTRERPTRVPVRQLGAILAATVVAAGGMLLVSSLHWLRLAATRPAPFGPVRAEVTGRSEFPALSGLAIVALLIAVLALVTGVWGRRVLGALLAATGVWCLVYGIRGLSTPSRTRLRALMPDSSTASYQRISADRLSWCPVVILLLALVLVAAGVALAARAAEYSAGLSARYSAPAEARRVDDPWRRLDRGEDPTVSDG